MDDEEVIAEERSAVEVIDELLAEGLLDRAVEVASELRAADLAEVLDYLDGDPHEALVRAMPAEVVAPALEYLVRAAWKTPSRSSARRN